jgi:hypothetical protein
MIMNKNIALVTNVLDDVDPPAVNVLLENGYDVVAQDPDIQETNQQEAYRATHPGTIPLGIYCLVLQLDRGETGKRKSTVILSLSSSRK